MSIALEVPLTADRRMRRYQNPSPVTTRYGQAHGLPFRKVDSVRVFSLVSLILPLRGDDKNRRGN